MRVSRATNWQADGAHVASLARSWGLTEYEAQRFLHLCVRLVRGVSDGFAEWHETCGVNWAAEVCVCVRG